MGFFNAMKAANMNFGKVESPDFPASYLTKDGDGFMITGAQKRDFKFTKADVKEFKFIASGASWIKFKIVFASGKSGIITSHVNDPAGQQGTSVAPIERFFGDLL